MRPLLTSVAVLLSVASTACTGAALWPEGGDEPPPPADTADAGTRVGSWTLVKDGLPAGATLLDAAYLDGAVYAIAEAQGQTDVFALRRDALSWSAAGPTRASAAERFRGFAISDRALYLTASDDAANTGSVYSLRFSDDPWTRLANAPSVPLSAIARKGTQLLVASHGAAQAAGLYASADSGATWTQVAGASSGAAFLARPVRTFAVSSAAQRMFATGEAASGFGGLYASDDGGASWQRLAIDGDADVVDVRAGAEFVLVSMTTGGELRSDNYGSTFHPLTVGATVRGFQLSGARAFAVTDQGVLLSDDGGLSWRSASEGLPATARLDSVFVAGATVVAAGGGDVFVAFLK